VPVLDLEPIQTKTFLNKKVSKFESTYGSKYFFPVSEFILIFLLQPDPRACQMVPIHRYLAGTVLYHLKGLKHDLLKHKMQIQGSADPHLVGADRF
jgi:hypothetical protein